MRDITLCHPRLQRIASAWIKACATEGITVDIGETQRTVAEQDALYAQGRTKPGNIVTNAKGNSYSSQHQWGIAFDFYLKMDVDGMFKKAAELAKALGLAWGGDWRSIVDKPHLYLPDWGSATNILKQRYGTFEAFKKTWPKMDVAPVKADSDAGAADLKDIKSGAHGLSVTASSLIIRTAPAGADSGKRYSKDQQVQPIRKCFVSGAPWIQTADGWVSGKYLTGWVCQDGRWWYLLSGYTYRHDAVCQIDGQAYAFDSDGWMITADRIAEDGHIR